MTLVQSWIDSLQLLKPKNLKLFILVTIKAILEAYKLFFKYFWWLVILYLFCYIPSILSVYSIVIAIALQKLLFFMICTITRPSIVKKNCFYFKLQFYTFMYFILFWMAIIGISYLLGNLLRLPQEAGLLPFFAWSIFFTLFFLDSKRTFKNFFLSMWYGLKMILFNLPLVFCIYGMIWLFDITVLGVADWITSFIFNTCINFQLKWSVPILRYISIVRPTIEIFLLPIGVCTYANIYIKKLHDQFDLYIKQPQ